MVRNGKKVICCKRTLAPDSAYIGRSLEKRWFVVKTFLVSAQKVGCFVLPVFVNVTVFCWCLFQECPWARHFNPTLLLEL